MTFALFVGRALTPVPVIAGVVALRYVGSAETAVVVALTLLIGPALIVAFAELMGSALIVEVLLSVIGAECVWTTAEPLVVHVVC